MNSKEITIDPFHQDATSFREKFIFYGFDSEEDTEFLSLKDALIYFLSEIHKNYTTKRVEVQQVNNKNIDGDYANRNIRLGKSSKTKLLNLIHEFTHFLEHDEFRKILIDEQKYFGSLDTPTHLAILKLKRLISSSYCVKGLNKLLTEIKKTNADNNKIKYLEYWLSDSELFARAYEQYILTKIKSYMPKKYKKNIKLLQEKLDIQMTIRSETMFNQYYWKERDFVKICNGFDKLFNITAIEVKEP